MLRGKLMDEGGKGRTASRSGSAASLCKLTSVVRCYFNSKKCKGLLQSDTEALDCTPKAVAEDCMGEENLSGPWKSAVGWVGEEAGKTAGKEQGSTGKRDCLENSKHPKPKMLALERGERRRDGEVGLAR